MDSHSQVLDRLRASFRSGVTVPEQFRLAQLQRLLSLVKDNEQLIVDALLKDLAKPKFETMLSEVDMVLNEVYNAIYNLRTWMQPECASTNLATKFDTCTIRRIPLGVVLIIGAWNYPLHLSLIPLVAAIAAGNCAVIKPSEVSAATETLLAELIPKYLSPDCFVVVRGGPEETKKLLENRFDHIFYTGSQSVARSILQAAAVHLTPVTLELGGKCPCFIFGKVDIPAAARRLVWSKFFNAGQSCVAPDYVLCSSKTRDALIPEIRKALEDFYTKEPRTSPDLGRIVSDRHWTRLTELLERSKGTVVVGGESHKEDKYMAPTVVIDVDNDDALMEEEIFGPILPMLTVESLEEGIDLINDKEKPLALYVFSDESSVVTTVMEKTSSGGFCSNDGIVHMTLTSLPFGGVGASGFGSYHGRWGFEALSHRRSCMLRGWALERINVLRYPPYRDDSLAWLRWSTTAKRKGWSSCSLM